MNQAIIITDLYGTGIMVNSVDPGWLATDGYRYGVGSSSGGRSVEDGAKGIGIVRAATLPDNGPTGGIFL